MSAYSSPFLHAQRSLAAQFLCPLQSRSGCSSSVELSRLRRSSSPTRSYHPQCPSSSPARIPSRRHHTRTQIPEWSKSEPMATAVSAAADVAGDSAQVRVMVVSDLDNTMVDHKDPENDRLKQFAELWQSQPKGNLLVYSTGRSPTLYKQLKSEKPMLTPDIVICSVGTEICMGPEMTPDPDWEKLLDSAWDRSAVLEECSRFPKLRLQADTEQRPHKVSFNVEKSDADVIIEELTKRLAAKGLKTKIIYSGGYDLDILPEGAGKGKALEYLLKKMRSEGRHPWRTLACGDSGNDVELFTVKDDGVYGVIVGNAMDELVQWYTQQEPEQASHVFKATERCAAGIVQALKHFKMV